MYEDNAVSGFVDFKFGAGIHETSKLFAMDIEPEKEVVLILAKVKEKPLNKPVKEASTEKKEKTKLTYMEQKEWATIEEDITQLETKLETLTEEMNHQGDDFVRLQELQEAVTATEQLLEEKMNRWEYLSEYAD